MTEPSSDNGSAGRRRYWHWLLAVSAPLGLLGLYALAGFVGVPWFIRHQLPDLVRESLGREVVLGEARFNPFTLRLQLQGVALHDHDGTTLVAFDSLLADLEAGSLWHRALALTELHLDKPHVNAVRNRAGAINLLSLQPPAAPEEEDDSALPRLMVRHLRLSGGTIDVTDEMTATAFHTRLAPVDLTLENLSTLPDTTGRHQLTVTLESNTRLDIKGDLSLNPLRASGDLHLGGPLLGLAHRYLGEELRFAAPEGQLETRLHFDLQVPATGEPAVALDDIDIKVRNLALHVARAPPFLQGSELHLAGGRLRWPEQSAHAQSLTLKGLAIEAARDAAGNIDLSDLLLPVRPAATEPATASGDDSADWEVTVARFAVEDLRASFSDATAATPARIAIADLDLELRDLTLEDGAQLPLDARLELEQGGVLKLAGTVSVLPELVLDAELGISEFAFAQLQPYVDHVLHVDIRSGNLALEGHVTSDPQETLVFDGNVSVRDLDLHDRVRRERLLAWHELGLDDLRLRLDAGRLRVSRVRLDRPFARLFIDRDQSTNYGDLLVESGPAAESTATPAMEQQTGFRTQVGKVLVVKGGVDFTDLSLPLPFAANVEDLQGELTTIDTASSAPSRIGLEGRVGEYGLAQVNGELRTSSPTDFADVGVVFRNIDMVPLSPYTVKFAGRKIAGGRIDLDLRYRLDERRMQGTNRIVIDELVLGEKVPHPEATDLPLGLAVMLLKDANGRIDLDMPVSGSLDDPEFRIGPVLWRAFVKLVTRVASSPFRLLGNLVGMESGDLGLIEFAAGRAELLPPEREKLQRLATALAQRPEIAVAVPRVVDPQVDGVVLRAGKLQAAIDSALAADGAAPEGRTLERQTRRIVESMYAQQFPDRDLDTLRASFTVPPADDPGGRARLDELAYLDRLRADLVTVQTVSADDLAALAAAREAALRTALTAPGALGPERVQSGESHEVSARDGVWIGAKLVVQATEQPVTDGNTTLFPGR